MVVWTQDDIHRFRSRAEELRTKADEFRISANRQILLQMAEYYEHLANDADTESISR